MVLAFVVHSLDHLRQLLGHLRVEFEDSGGFDSLFYVNSDTVLWRDVTQMRFYCYDYLDQQKPIIGVILDARKTQAAVHPRVVALPNEFYRYCRDKPEQRVLKEALGLVFLNVLLINRQFRSRRLS